MAALTTFAAGASVMSTKIVAFYELGSFLMIVMTFSWLYSTFFFQSLLSAFGPNGNFCQLSPSSLVAFIKQCTSKRSLNKRTCHTLTDLDCYNDLGPVEDFIPPCDEALLEENLNYFTNEYDVPLIH